MKKIFSSNNFWLFLAIVISFLFLLSSYMPNFYEASIVKSLPEDRVMTPAEHMYTYDYNVYLSKINQGMEGRWSVVDKYDNNLNQKDQKGVFLQMTYLLAGKVGKFLQLSPGLTFHLLRTVVSVLWIFTIIFLNFYFLKKPLLAFLGVLLSLFSASWPVFYAYQGTTWIGMHMSWWQELDVLKRISYIPHYTLNYIIIAVLTILLTKYQPLESKSVKPGQTWLEQYNNIATSAIVLFISFFIHPAAGLLFLISWVFYHFINLVWYKKYNRNQVIKIFYDTVILVLVASLPLIYFQYITSDYPWKSLVDFDKFNRYPVNIKEYILALGPIFVTGIFGLILALIKKEQKYLSLVTWILGAFLAIFAFKKFPLQSELRFVQTANHIPLAILSIYFLFSIKMFLLNGWQKWKGSRQRTVEGYRIRSEHWWEGNFWQDPFNLIFNILIFGIFLAIITLGLAQSYFSIKAQTDFIHQRVVAGQPLVPYPPQVMYPLKDMFNAFVWLDKNTKNEDVVLSHIYAGNYIPAYSGNFVYLGHNPETPHYDERVRKLEVFYSGTLSDKDAIKFLKEEKISYILYGPQEKQKSIEDIKKYLFIKQVFNSSYLTLYYFKN